MKRQNRTNDSKMRDFSVRTNEARKYRKARANAMVFLCAATIFIWFAMLLVKYYVFEVDWMSLFDDILANILGILPPIIIFNFAYEYITRDSAAEETSAQIAKVLMSDADTIALYDEEPKKRFLMATLSSLVENEHEADMIYGVMEPYIDHIYNIRKNFEYEIFVRECRAEEAGLFDPSKYFMVKESLHYSKMFMGTNTVPSQIKVGFMTDMAELDDSLVNDDYIFSENLCVEEDVIKSLLGMTDDERMQWVAEKMHLHVSINTEVCRMVRVLMSRSCMCILFDVGSDISGSNEIELGVEFIMPQLRSQTDFLVSITEPTFNPYIKFDYPEDIVKVEMFPFMNDGAESRVKNAQNDMGECKIRMRDKWVYPISGVVFTMQPIEKS